MSRVTATFVQVEINACRQPLYVWIFQDSARYETFGAKEQLFVDLDLVMQRLKLILLFIRFCALKTLIKRVLPISSCICVICERAVMQIRCRIVLHHTHGACYTLINDARIYLGRELFWPRKQTRSMRTFIAILRPPRTLLIFFHHGIDSRYVFVAILPI